jgi:cytochrome c-type biogenesis protein CcmH/NrfG
MAADTYGRIDPAAAEEIRSELEVSLRLMPNFGPAQHLLGFLEILQGESLEAEQHLKRAIQLEPERTDYLLTLAQAQVRSHNPEAARRTLESLRPSYIEPALRDSALKLLEKIGK